MQDIAAPCVHELLEFRLALLMYQCQIDNKSLAKITNFSLGDADVFFTELALNLFPIARVQKQGLPYIHHHIKSKLSVRSHNGSEFLAIIGLMAIGTSESGAVGMELTNAQRGQRTGVCFQYGEPLATGTNGAFRPEVQRGRLEKKVP